MPIGLSNLKFGTPFQSSRLYSCPVDTLSWRSPYGHSRRQFMSLPDPCFLVSMPVFF